MCVSSGVTLVTQLNRSTAHIGRTVVRNGLLKFIIGARKMDVVNVNIISVLNRVIGEITAVRDALNTVGTQPTDVQQLKAEIAALVTKLDSDYHGGCGVNVNSVIDKLRQLSAV